MQTEEFTTKDNNKGKSYKLEAGDKVVSAFKNVGTTERAVVVNGKPVI